MSPAREQPDPCTTFEAQLDHELNAVKKARDCLGAARRRVAESPTGKQKEEDLKIPQGKAEGGGGANAYDRAHDSNLLGLAFSGGGIRSATFNLGVIQLLARLRLLQRVDYLSTVSGGGYIGGWLSAWVHREQADAKNGIRPGILSVEDRLRKDAACGEGSSPLPEPRQVRWLREFSNYLTPRVGALSTDTLTGVATYLRNLLLNQAILIASGASLLVLPWVLAALLPHLGEGWIELGLWFAALLLLAGSLVAGYETLRADLGSEAEDTPKKDAEDVRKKADAAAGRAAKRFWFLFSCFAAAAVVVGMLITFRPTAAGLWWIAVFGGAYGVGTSLGWWTAVLRFRKKLEEVNPRTLQLFLPVWALIGGAGLGGMVQLWAWFLNDPTTQLTCPLAAVALGPLVLLGAILLTITLHLGLAGSRLREAGRELWSSHGAQQMRFGIIWLIVSFSSLFGPLALMLVDNWVAALGGLTWVVTTTAGVLAGSGATTGPRGGSKAAEVVARIAPYVFVGGILLIVSYGVYRAIWWQWSVEGGSPREIVCEPSPRKPVYELDLKAGSGATVGSLYDASPQSYKCLRGYVKESALLVEGHLLGLLVAMLGLLIAALALSCRVDINIFSLHMFYRNRIERCYMGASNLQRCPHPLTGLDPTDTPKLTDLSLWGGGVDVPRETPLPAPPWSPFVRQAWNTIANCFRGENVAAASKASNVAAASKVSLLAQRPIHIVNTALNITSARNLAWQERKAASLTFTPMYCGYEIQAPDGQTLSCYQPTEDYAQEDQGRLFLGLPITISGAAASPNGGYHTSAATAFLMTVFNVRLGWWLQNPLYGHLWQQPGPKGALRLLMQELFGMTSDKSGFVYLSDGGHFENLGIYELVRRRCRYIIACDVGYDPKYGFEDLGNAVRKCQIDFGIDIEIDPRVIRPDSGTGRSGAHCAVGRIHYERVDKNQQPGYLLYVKASLTGDEPADILQYASRHGDFPHETTSDQWYSESQFESYRKLGYQSASSVLADAVGEQGAKGAASGVDLEEVFTALSERWYPPNPQVRASFSKYGEAIEAIFEQVRKDEALRFLDEQIYPEWRHLTKWGREGKPAPTPQMLPENAWEIRAGFYLCNSLLQIMENVYHDLNLEEQYLHPDNRGWMNLFRHWSWAGMLRVTWAISASMYGARFQRFCRQRLDLKVGEVCCDDPVRFRDLKKTEKGRLNFIESDHVRKIVGRCFCDRARSLLVVQLSLRVINPFEGKEGAGFAFPFAFALIDDMGAGPEVLYYRVRDHLREIGLGRKGLGVLLNKRAAVSIAELDAEKQESISTVIPEANYQALRRLWTSVTVAQEGRGSGEFDPTV